MFAPSLRDDIMRILEQAGPLSVRELMDALSYNYRNPREREKIHSLLYGELNKKVIRDKNEDGMPTWRVRNDSFEAAKGLEIMFYTRLLQEGIIDETSASLDTTVENRRNRKTYHIDLAIEKDDQAYDIEIDGFEHIRADALASLQKQLQKNSDDVSVQIDWMDNERSYVDFGTIDRSFVYKWLSSHPSWCIRFHEELLWPHDITRNMWLIENGWKIVRFWNFEVQNELARCMQEVKEVLYKRHS